jgi:hypothetical protein
MKFKWITNTTAAALVAFVAVVGMQFFASSKAVYQARESAVLAWTEANPDEAEVVERYQQECQKGPAENTANKMPVRPLTSAECAEKVGSKSLASAIEAADQSVEIPAPLRWL